MPVPPSRPQRRPRGARAGWGIGRPAGQSPPAAAQTPWCRDRAAGVTCRGPSRDRVPQARPRFCT